MVEKPGRLRTAVALLAGVSLLCGMVTPARAAGEPTPGQPSAEALKAYTRYVELTHARVESELKAQGSYLWVDLQPAAQRAKYLQQLHNGEVVIEALDTRDNGEEIECPDGLIHHWVGTVFIPGATLDGYLAFVQDYNRHQEYFAPDVQQSRLLERRGDHFQVFFRFHKKKATVTAVHDTWHDVDYFRLSPTRAGSHTVATRILDVDNPGEKNERHRSAEEDRGYLWRLETWWRFEQRDGGVYVQCESVSLTRDVPWGLGWLVGPVVKSIPREQLAFTLGNSRTVLMQRQATSSTP